MVKMLTLFGKDISKMKYGELKRERKCQKSLLALVRTSRNDCAKRTKQGFKHNGKFADIRADKIAFLTMYEEHLEALIEEIDYWMDRRAASPKDSPLNKQQLKEENRKRNQRVLNDNHRRWTLVNDEKNDLYVSWDRDKFNLIAADRGYHTEEMILSAVAEELRLTRTNARLAIQGGRWTWGQVLCLGAMLEMTPKEFCDTFLAGYFVDRYGEYRAEYENLDKPSLLKRAVKSNPLTNAQFEEIEVDVDGRPLGEDTVWFDD